MDNKYERMIPGLAYIAEEEDHMRCRENALWQEARIKNEAIALANILHHTLTIIPFEDREKFSIPGFINPGGLRNALIRGILKPNILTSDELDHLDSARGITRWLNERMSLYE